MEGALREVLERDNEVVFAYLYGSFLEGSPVRDVDVVRLREAWIPPVRTEGGVEARAASRVAR